MALDFVDIDFATQTNYVLGYDNTAFRNESSFGVTFSDVAPVIPRSQWKELANDNLEKLLVMIFNQRSEGSCVSNASAQAHQILQAKQYGKDRVIRVSAMSLYKRCGSGPSSGSTVSGNWRELNRRGILPLDVPENSRFAHRHPATGWGVGLPGGWETTAALFAATEAVIIDSVDEFVSAVLYDWPVVYGRRGHSICCVSIVYDGGQPFGKYANSWGSWGVAGGDFHAGFGHDSLRILDEGSDWAYALRSVKAPIETL